MLDPLTLSESRTVPADPPLHWVCVAWLQDGHWLSGRFYPQDIMAHTKAEAIGKMIQHLDYLGALPRQSIIAFETDGTRMGAMS
jgi:hypothetical protein